MNAMNPVKDCPACGSTAKPQPLYRKWGYQIERCPDCGLGSTALDDRFDPASIYSREYFDGSQSDGYADYPGSESVLRKEFKTAVDSLVRHGRTSGSLFEIGCAYGFFLLEARKYFDVRGIEVCGDAAVHCRDRGLDVATGLMTEETLAKQGPLDVVVLLDVIEHLTDPLGVLRMVHKHLNPGGHVLITTGDWDSALSRLMGSSWRLMTPPQHVFFFSHRTMESILSRVGFHVVQFERPSKLVPLSLALFQLARILGIRPGRIPFLRGWAVPLNLFDAMRVIAVKV